ncbi:thioredoxin domain-containing protein [Candidatus Daviesbacteria bacterium]|nr:thioredoxin domain-containing protein [Candidatus Daviesbacteria bacterium]
MVSGLYEVVVLYQGQQVPIYVTADGKNLVQGLTPLDLLAQQTGATGSVGSTEPSSAQVTEVSLDDDPVLGNPNAPITIIEFSDYQCPFCQRFWTETLPLIKSQYIDTGKVKLVYRDFPLSSIHPDAQKAAEAAECADEQGKYWEYHDKLFENQFDLSITALKRYAQELGLNTEKFNTCLDSGQMASEVSKDLSEGTAAGVQGTPGFFINGRFLGGAYPFEQFKTIIDEELAKIA